MGTGSNLFWEGQQCLRVVTDLCSVPYKRMTNMRTVLGYLMPVANAMAIMTINTNAVTNASL
jgi:hypothetical protein